MNINIPISGRSDSCTRLLLVASLKASSPEATWKAFQLGRTNVGNMLKYKEL